MKLKVKFTGSILSFSSTSSQYFKWENHIVISRLSEFFWSMHGTIEVNVLFGTRTCIVYVDINIV